MNYNVCKLKMLEGFRFYVTFEDNSSGEVRVPQSWLTGVFTPLRDLVNFKKAFINQGAVAWLVNGDILDLAPDTMYKEIKSNNGIYVLGERNVTKNK